MHYVAQNLGNCGLKIVEQNHWLVEGDVFGQCFVIFWIFFAVDFAVNPTFMPRISVWAGWNDQCEWGRPLEIWRRARERRRKGVLGLSEIGEVTVSGGIQVRAVEEFVQERLCIFSSQSLVFFPPLWTCTWGDSAKAGAGILPTSAQSLTEREKPVAYEPRHMEEWFGLGERISTVLEGTRNVNCLQMRIFFTCENYLSEFNGTVQVNPT